MTLVLRIAGILVLALLVDACTKVGHILQKDPIRTLNFTGSHKVVAECLSRRLGGRVQPNRFNDDQYVLYSSAKGQSSQGLTHWAMTVGRYNANEGFVEWRVVTPPATGRGPGAMPLETPLSDEAVKMYWGAAEDCARQAKPPA